MTSAIVIGAGIAGCSTAYALAKRGAKVTLIERHNTIAHEASGNHAAMLYPKFNTGLSQLSLMAAEGFGFTLSLLKNFPNNAFFSICGQIQLAFNAQEQIKQNTLINANRQNQTYSLISAAEASEIASIKLHHSGLYIPDSGWVQPKSFCEALIASNFIQRQIATHAIKIEQAGNDWEVHLNQSEVLKANHIVICNANALHQFEQCRHIPFTPVRGQINYFKPNAYSKNISSIICSDHYLSPAIDGLHTFGTTYAPNDLNPNISDLDTKANLMALKKISSNLYDKLSLNGITGRVAWRSATKDYMPLAGAILDAEKVQHSPPRYNDDPKGLPWLKGLYVNAGHGSKGMITAPICGELIANHIFNEPSVLGALLSTKVNPSRFLLREMGLKRMAQNLYDF